MNATQEKVIGHTPGPWKVRGETGVSCARVEVVSHINGYTIADAGVSTNTFAQANARLIAAAPDLLAVVKALAYWDRKADDERISEEGELDGLYEICERARATIAKAEGSSL